MRNAVVDGILNINKPEGKTSFDIVALVKHHTGVRRVGHAGTLDPMATGVLPICLGKGTRIIEFLAEGTKTYQAQIELGVVTDTYDATGKVLQQTDPSGVSREQVTSALTSFQGLIQQTPPIYSAVRHQGKKMYELARAGVAVVPRSRPTHIHRIAVTDWQPPLVNIEVECGKGTYIRSLAHDLGQALGCGATLKRLVRSSYGPFDITGAVSTAELQDACRDGCWQCLMYPLDAVLLHWNAIIINEANKEAIRKGAPPTLENAITPPESAPRCRAYTTDGDFLGVLSLDAERGRWQPEKVLL